MPTLCAECKHWPSVRHDCYQDEICSCKCHDVADAAPALLAALKELDSLLNFGQSDAPAAYVHAAAAIRLAENSADCSYP